MSIKEDKNGKDNDDKKNENKENSSNYIVLLAIVSGLISIVFGIIVQFLTSILPQIWHGIIFRFLLGSFVIFLFIFFEAKSSKDFLGIVALLDSNTKPNAVFIIKSAFFIYIMFTFIFAPNIYQNFKNNVLDVLNQPTITTSVPEPTPSKASALPLEEIIDSLEKTTIVPTVPTVVPTNTSIPPTATITPTPTSRLFKYKVGVIAQNENCGEKDKNELIIEGLKKIGFDAFEVEINDYSDIDVLYLPYGWSCTVNKDYQPGINNFLDRGGTGLFIGDPAPENKFTFQIYQSILEFNPMTDEQISQQNFPIFIDEMTEPDIKYKYLFFNNISQVNYPRAESELTVERHPGDGNFSYYIILQHVYDWRPSLVSPYPPYNDPSKITRRYIIMPGSEYSVSEYAVPEIVMRDIILWLAHGALN